MLKKVNGSGLMGQMLKIFLGQIIMVPMEEEKKIGCLLEFNDIEFGVSVSKSGSTIQSMAFGI